MLQTVVEQDHVWQSYNVVLDKQVWSKWEQSKVMMLQLTLLVVRLIIYALI